LDAIYLNPASTELPYDVGHVSGPKNEMKRYINHQYGKVKTTISNHLNLEICDYARKHQALAVLTNDSDFFVFNGAYQIWSTDSIKFETSPRNVTIMRYNRTNLWSTLGLSDDQVAIFATYAGNKSFIPNDDSVKFLKTLGNFWQQRFFLLAEYINKNGLRNETSGLVEKIYKDIFGTGTPDDQLMKDAVQNCLNHYNVVLVEQQPHPDELVDFAVKNNMIDLFVGLTGHPSSYSLRLEDLRVSKGFAAIVKPMICKVFGIFLQHKNDDTLKGKMLAKLSHESEFAIHKLDPVYPERKFYRQIYLFKRAHFNSDSRTNS
jgi:XPG domain containing